MTGEIDREQLFTPLREAGTVLSVEEEATFEKYIHLLVDECTRQNLSKYRTPEEIVTYHLLDSLEPVRNMAFEGGERCVDIGTGGGCPGIPIKIVLPGLSMGLLDSRERRCGFLRRCVEELGLERTGVLHGRAENLAHSPMHRGAYDIALARSVAPLRQLVEMAVPFLCEGGELWAFRGEAWMDELDDAQAALELLNAEPADSITYRLPGRKTDHALLVITATGDCDDQYPRSTKHIRKRPL